MPSRWRRWRRPAAASIPKRYLDRGWRYLLSNHTHDANGGCAARPVCQDMEYRYRKASDIGEIAVEDAMGHVAVNLSPEGQPADAMQLLVVNPLPFARDAVALVDVEMPAGLRARNVRLSHATDPAVRRAADFLREGGLFRRYRSGTWSRFSTATASSSTPS